MPFVRTCLNQPLSPEKQQQLKQAYAENIAIMNKREKFLMLEFCENSALSFAGSDAPAAMVEVNLYGEVDGEASAAFTAAVCAMLQEKLDIPPDRVFVSYRGHAHWGWNGGNF